MPGWDESYPLLSNALAPEYRVLPREQVDSIIEGVFGPGTSLEDAEGFLDDLGHTLSNAARVAAPVAQRALPGVISGAASGAALGPYGMLAGALIGGATSARSAAASPHRQQHLRPVSGPAPLGASVAAPASTAPAAGANGAILQLLGALGSPTVEDALNAMLMGRAGAQTTQTASGGTVPVGAITNMLGTLAGHASAEWEALWPSAETESYGEGLDTGSPEARAEWLYGELAPVPVEAREDEAAWLDEVYDELDAEFLVQVTEAYDEGLRVAAQYGWSAWSLSTGG